MFRIENKNYSKKFLPIQNKIIKKTVKQQYIIGDMKLSANVFYNLNDGWLICNGLSLSIHSYPELFSVIGNAFGNIDDEHFNLPDYTSRVIGISGKSKLQSFSLTERKIGESIGTEAEILQIENLSKHSHNGVTELGGLHTHNSKVIETIIETNIIEKGTCIQTSSIKTDNERLRTYFSSESGIHQHHFISSEIGENKSHNNIQPTLFGCVVLIYAENHN